MAKNNLTLDPGRCRDVEKKKSNTFLIGCNYQKFKTLQKDETKTKQVYSLVKVPGVIKFKIYTYISVVFCLKVPPDYIFSI